MGIMLTILWMLGLPLALDRIAGAPASGGHASIALDPAHRARLLPLPPISGAEDPGRPLVVIDPGHGGADPGASSLSGRREKDVTLALARAVQSELASSRRIRVALTRNDDESPSLVERYEIARRLGADLFISIHADAAPHNSGARGATIYTLSEVASDREAALLAARENGASGADRIMSPGINRILIDLAQREAMTSSADFARLLHREASALFSFQRDYHRFASLIVLKAPDMPSILFEAGYLTNEADEAFLESEAGRKNISQGIRKAIETHFARQKDL